MTIIEQWARDWAIAPTVMNDLMLRLAHGGPQQPAFAGDSEAAILSRVRVRASQLGMRVWRNNVGAGYGEDGQFMRWGLANDSPLVNRVFKSADLIGINPVLVTAAHVGQRIGQFVSFEVKHSGWKYAGSERERAQVNWGALISTFGGDARFITSEAQL
jgi:hypothetical protein